MIAIFKTDVNGPASEILIHKLRAHFPGGRVSIDLEDCDKVLRVEAGRVVHSAVIRILLEEGFLCEELS